MHLRLSNVSFKCLGELRASGFGTRPFKYLDAHFYLPSHGLVSRTGGWLGVGCFGGRGFAGFMALDGIKVSSLSSAASAECMEQ